jgi:hypothetical protein
MAKRSWSELSTPDRAGIVLVAAVEAVLTTTALRDLHSRNGSDVNGPKWVWRLALLVQPVGPAAYLLLGRKRG